jgi:hypothetical protein
MAKLDRGTKKDIRQTKNDFSAVMLGTGTGSRPMLSTLFVHGVGIGVGKDGEVKLRVYVTSVLTRPGAWVVDRLLRLVGPWIGRPMTFQDVPIELVAAARPTFALFGGQPIRHFDGCPYNVPTDGNQPIPAGVSVFKVEPPRSVGTIGYYCQSVTGAEEKFLLSCNHVLVFPEVNFNEQTREEANLFITRQGEDPAIGEMTEYVELKEGGVLNAADAAIMKMKDSFRANAGLTRAGDGGVGTTMIRISAMDDFDDLVPEMPVTKHGVATCWTDGVVESIDCDFIMDYAGRSLLMANQFRIIGHDAAGNVVPFAKGMDSGSLVVRPLEEAGVVTSYRATGLLFAIGKLQEVPEKIEGLKTLLLGDPYTLASPIDVVIAELNIKLTEQNKDPIALITETPI